MNIDSLKFGPDGLIPVIVQDFYTKRVLTLAYMNRESLEITLKEKKTCFFSRSRQKLWRKGETSGNFQQIVRLVPDCDYDALIAEVIKDGPACHLGSDSCFDKEPIYERENLGDFSLEDLYALIQGRKTEKKEGSYTTYLFEKGDDKILKKVGEECTEVIIAAKNNDNAELRFEISDLCYHILVMMAQKGITISQIKEELASRHVVDKKVKQEKMQ
ncbi:MAG: bifunctional phosphoribosyl-AMP cyclohydrolase/phosphoribosyl-ATP diphosphatase HisIE [Oscillospiraceae bacterium]|nr:bifunctional phosphoribosyl-AMP cyclohydrolase/phosphoribosyl-ATP diphosphatase HisIE [Oscillospiraceae bacterium]